MESSRNFREEDGAQFYQIAITGCRTGKPRGTDMLKLFKEGELKRIHGIWAPMKTPETGIR